MADPTFCTIDDLQGYEPDILDLSPNGNLNVEMAAARKEIEDRLIITGVLLNLDKLGADIQPRQLRLPSIFKTLEMIYRNHKKDDESPYAAKQEDYFNEFNNTFDKITCLDLDQNEDGVIDESEENSAPAFTGLMRRR